MSVISLSDKAAAKALLSIGAVHLSPKEPFTWASGIKSPIYTDNRLVLSYPEARKIIEERIAEAVKGFCPDADILMGTSTAGIAHAALAADILGLPMGYVRSSSKDHGLRSLIEGKSVEGLTAVVIEDLISTGGSCIETAQALRDAGATVPGVVSIFTYGLDRAEEKFTAANLSAVSVTDITAVAEVAVAEGYIGADDLAVIERFRAELNAGK